MIVYNFNLRLVPILSLICSTAAAVTLLYFWWDVWTHARLGDYDYSGILLIPKLVLCLGIGPLLLTFFITTLRSTWFFVYLHELIGGQLRVDDPLLRKSILLDLSEVGSVQGLAVLGPKPGTKATLGHILKNSKGDQVCISESLLIWPEIFQQCSHAKILRSKNRWWQITK